MLSGCARWRMPRFPGTREGFAKEISSPGLHTRGIGCVPLIPSDEEKLPMPTPAPSDPEAIDVRAEIDRLIDALPPIALLRLWRLLIAWTAPRSQRRRRPAGRREGA